MARNSARSVAKTATTSAAQPGTKPRPRGANATTAPAGAARRLAKELFAASPYPRIAQIHAILRQGKPVTSVSLAAELEVSQRTIKRDLGLMVDGMGLPLEWDPGEHSWVYTRDCDTLPLLRMDAREALGMALFARLSRRWIGSALGRVLESMLEKVTPLFGDVVSINADAAASVLLPAHRQDDDRELEHFFVLLEAILARTVLRLEYCKPHSARPEKRLVHPLHLAELDGGWVLVAFDPRRDALRHFVLGRMRGVTSTGATFEPPKQFDIQQYLRGSLGRFVGETEYEVRIALDAHAAFYARERPWHSSQQLAEQRDGSVELTLRLNHLADIRSAVLRWGRHAEVLAPVQLRDDIRAEHAAALERYGSATTPSP